MSDEFTVPLCRAHHWALHDSGDERSWWKDIQIEPLPIAQQLWVSEAAVKQHLLRLYDKFGVSGDGERRRTKLANEALRRGAITLAEVRAAAAAKDS